jgi:prepilin-type processing-associated H-X9-DG protein
VRSHNSGFTLLEFMTVMVLIELLAAILLPVFSHAQQKAWAARCLVNLTNIGTALRMYAADYYGWLPAAACGLEVLVGRGEVKEETLTCPSVPTRPGEKPAGAYLYRPGLCDDGDPDEIVAADRYADVHNGGCNFLWLDGHVRWLEAPTTKPGRAAQPQAPTDAGRCKGLPALRRQQKLLWRPARRTNPTSCSCGGVRQSR